jgi:hypothetical protein
MVYVTPPEYLSSFVSGSGTVCPDTFGCAGAVDFWIKRHDTRPPFKVAVEDCDGTPMDLTGLILEASMWVKGRLKRDLEIEDESFALSNDVGFEQCSVGDIIVFNQVRAPEQMLITGFDENLKLIQVQRGYNGTLISRFKRGSGLKIFRILNAIATTEFDQQDILQVDGNTLKDVLTESRLVYEWLPADTCLPGCFYFEFKLLKMSDSDTMIPMLLAPSTPSFISYTSEEMGCESGSGVEWVRRFPMIGEGYVIRIMDSPTSENLF